MALRQEASHTMVPTAAIQVAQDPTPHGAGTIPTSSKGCQEELLDQGQDIVALHLAQEAVDLENNFLIDKK